MNFKIVFLLATFIFCRAMAEDLTTLDGQKNENVREVTLKPAGLFFVSRPSNALKGVTVPYARLTEEIKEKYHYDPYSFSVAHARQNQPVNLNKNLAFSLDQLEAAKKKATEEKKLLGFIMEWDTMMVPARPMGRGSESGLAHFYEVFHDNMVLVFVRHESELGKVPDAVNQGFGGPEEGGFAPNMAMVTADCSQFICEIPFGGNNPMARSGNRSSARNWLLLKNSKLRRRV